ncbi:MAG: lipoyl(octanoyl) transferase LipB [Mariprofundus sp.]|nr:lipoyl(octanoyl) transferase LipB [Mariprofundus sp.]
MHIRHHDSQDYPDSIAEQEALVADILAGKAASSLIFTEHPPVYTIGTSGSEQDVLHRTVEGERIDVYASGRGGEVTYHGPGQLICYVIADLRQQQDLHQHVHRLEQMIINTLAEFGVQAGRDERGIGVWVDGKKIAAIGVRCRKWITFHGIALNIDPNLKHFSGIVACGMTDSPVTSMRALGIKADRAAVEAVIARHSAIFNERL